MKKHGVYRNGKKIPRRTRLEGRNIVESLGIMDVCCGVVGGCFLILLIITFVWKGGEFVVGGFMNGNIPIIITTLVVVFLVCCLIYNNLSEENQHKIKGFFKENEDDEKK